MILHEPFHDAGDGCVVHSIGRLAIRVVVAEDGVGVGIAAIQRVARVVGEAEIAGEAVAARLVILVVKGVLQVDARLKLVSSPDLGDIVAEAEGRRIVHHGKSPVVA